MVDYLRILKGELLTNEPKAEQLQSQELDSYKVWLTLITEQISGSLNPNAKGKA